MPEKEKDSNHKMVCIVGRRKLWDRGGKGLTAFLGEDKIFEDKGGRKKAAREERAGLEGLTGKEKKKLKGHIRRK